MFAFNFKPPMDPHKPFSPIVEEKVKNQKPKMKVKVIKEESVKEKKNKIVPAPASTPAPAPIVELAEQAPAPTPVSTPVAEKKSRLVKGSEEAKAWAKKMRDKRDANKEAKAKSIAEKIGN